MSPEQEATINAAETILSAPKAHLEIELKEYPVAFLQILEVLTDHLFGIQAVGVGWRIIQLEIMKEKINLQPDLL